MRHRTYLNDIRKSGRHLLAIITDVLDMVKIESGTIQVQLGDVSVDEVVDDALHMLAQQIDEKRLTIAVDFDKRMPTVRADELKLRQILLNLLSNAAKFTPAGGAITVAAAPSHTEQLGDCVQIVVSDTGVGIAADELDTVLKPFGQGATACQQQLGGAGLGLTLCKALAEAHAGTLTIESEPHQGTRATVCLPIEPAMESAA